MGYSYEVEELDDDTYEPIWKEYTFPGDWNTERSNEGKLGWVEYPAHRIQEMIDKKEIRVKYLDKEDIESCGWKLRQEYADWSQYRKGNWTLAHVYNENRIGMLITDLSLEEHPHACGTFKGGCKSINELRKIMHWIKVNQ